MLECASGRLSSPVPWKYIVPHYKDYIEDKYLPPSFQFTKPDHLQAQQCVVFLNYLRQREEQFGTGGDVFAWKAICQKKDGIFQAVPALVTLNTPQRAKGTGKRKTQAMSLAEDLLMEDDDAWQSPDDVDWQNVDGRDSDSDLESEGEEEYGQATTHATWMEATLDQRLHASHPASESDADDDENRAPLPPAMRRKRGRIPASVQSDDDDDEMIDLPPGAATVQGTGTFPPEATIGLPVPIVPEPHPAGFTNGSSGSPASKVGRKRPRIEVDVAMEIQGPRKRTASSRLQEIEHAQEEAAAADKAKKMAKMLKAASRASGNQSKRGGRQQSAGMRKDKAEIAPARPVTPPARPKPKRRQKKQV